MMCKCKKFLEEKSNDKKVLFAMLLGIKQNEPDFADPEHDDCVFNTKGKNSWNPTAAELIQEVMRRHAVLFPTEEAKACKSWKKKKARQWLLDHPIVDSTEVRFLLEEEKKFREQLFASEKEQNQLDLRRNDWVGLLPWLRLAHVMVHDNVYLLYQEKDAWEGRAGTDGRNSDLRPKQWFEKAEEIYNDSAVVFHTLILPDLHTDF